MPESRRYNTSLALASDPGFQAIIRNDTESEYDANNFCTRLAERVAEGTLSLSPEFLKFEKAWRRDEMNHTLGFAMIESLLYGKTVGQIFEEIGSISPDFRPLEERGLLDDEFAVAIVIAYDEVSTALSYRDDFYHRYPKFDSPVLAEWIRRVASDEGHHFRNIVAVVKKNHAHRLPEVPALVRRILDWEESEHTYQRTFVLDHTGPQFTDGFISNAVQQAPEAVPLFPERPAHAGKQLIDLLEPSCRRGRRRPPPAALPCGSRCGAFQSGKGAHSL